MSWDKDKIWGKKVPDTLKVLDRELERLHELLKDTNFMEMDFNEYKRVLNDMHEIHDHLLTVSKRYAGLEY